MTLNKEQILAANDRRKESLTVPQWGGEVFVRSLSAKEALDLFAVTGSASTQRLLAYSLCDEQGDPLFALDEIDTLLSKGYEPVLTVIEAARRVNGLIDEEKIEKKP